MELQSLHTYICLKAVRHKSISNNLQGVCNRQASQRTHFVGVEPAASELYLLEDKVHGGEAA